MPHREEQYESLLQQFRFESQASQSYLGLTTPRCNSHTPGSTQEHGRSVSTGDLQLLDGRWYVTHAGLLRIARSKNCSGINRLLSLDCASICQPLGLQGNRLQISSVSGLRRLRRRRSVQHVFRRPWRRDARRRNAGRQPRSAQGLRNRPLLGRGARVFSASATGPGRSEVGR